ncbi:3-ketoacyl-CoA synthase 11-like [Rutidosis leptorrhynchoides]|uniref:3-ketoacyl-CoA synthase 11-like n=1 Tax=Rutidosis leptorrhynchoides TaxID=125765 RepID=UPI003A9A630A
MPIIGFSLKNLLENHMYFNFNQELKLLLPALLICLFLLGFYMTRKTSRNVYLVDFACYKPPDTQKCTKEYMMKKARHSGYFSDETLDFMSKVFGKSGLGDATYLSELYFKEVNITSMKEGRREMEMSVFGSIDILLAKTGVRSEDIGILIVNCCIYNTMPSLSSMIVNRYKLKESIISYNLVGMGCSAGLMAIGLADQLLQVHEDSYALVMSTESITENVYLGDDRSKVLSNCLFRVGGSAILLSNRRSDRRNCKYELLHTVHTNESSSDRSYNCIIQEEDDAGRTGITVTRYLFKAASAVVRSNVTDLGNLILPVPEKLRYVTNHIARKLLPTASIKPYVPNYSVAVDHFLPHVGGKPVLDELQKSLGFDETAMEASRMTLYRFGNTSSSSVWYELAYAEAKGRVKKGNRVWQMAFGSGFKCSSVVWRARRTVDYDEMNPWTAEIDEFPVDVDYDDGPLPFFSEPSNYIKIKNI